MSIIISKQGQSAQKIDRSDFEAEDNLQNYIHRNPEAIPVYEIEKDKKLFVVKREFETNSGPIDALAIDKDGDIYIVETKLYKNPDKRTVVAQALDYGAALWKHFNDFDEFMRILDQECQENFESTFQEKLAAFFSLDEEQVAVQLDSMRKNLNEGNLKFVILMDTIGERLKDLILYVNQNSQFDIYAVQLEYYRHEEYEIIIPRLFGVEVKKNVRASSSQRRKWTKEDFLQDAKEKSTSGAYKIIEDLLEFSYQNADKVVYGTGQHGLFSYKLNTPNGEITIFRLEAKGLLIFGLDYVLLQEKIPREMVHDLIKRLEDIPGMDVRNGTNFERSELYLELDKVADNSNEIKKIKRETIKFTKKVRARSK
jgi:hypothetical protein